MFGLFGKSKNTITNPKFLIASIGADDVSLVSADRAIYDSYFSEIETIQSETIDGFYDEIQHRTCDILHLFARVGSRHELQVGDGQDFFRHLSTLNIKILILASENVGDSLIPFCTEASAAGLDRVNMVMTLERKGEAFGRFFKSLFGSMIKGRTMPQAWVELAPQNPHMVHDAPETVFSA